MKNGKALVELEKPTEKIRVALIEEDESHNEGFLSSSPEETGLDLVGRMRSNEEPLALLENVLPDVVIVCGVSPSRR